MSYDIIRGTEKGSEVYELFTCTKTVSRVGSYCFIYKLKID